MRTGNQQAVVTLRDVRKRYGDQEIIRGVTLTATAGETTVIIGGSGAGKTTLLRLIVGLERPTSGEVLIDGENIGTMGERALNKVRQKFGVVFQYAALLDSNTVLENVAFPLVEHTKKSPDEIRGLVRDKLKILGLDPDIEAKFPSELSGGMRKRVGLARALMLEPKILVYDEPTSGLDPITSRLVDELIDEMRVRFKVTSIVISHDIASCFRIAHQAILLMRGEVLGCGTPDDLANSSNEETRRFVEASQTRLDNVQRASRPGR